MIGRVYFMRPVGEQGPVKIGHSRFPRERLRALAAWSPLELEIAATIPGGRQLEGRFHAAFMGQHLRSEWFAASPALSATIEEIRQGAFDTDTLPPFAVTRQGWKPSRESIEAGVFNRRAQKLASQGVSLPREVYEALFTYRCDPEETARRRAIVREFVLAQKDPA